MPQQPSILSFFSPKQKPAYAAPPGQAPAGQQGSAVPSRPTATDTTTVPASPPPPPPVRTSTGFPSPHPNATIVPLEQHHVPALRRINSLLLPVNYADSFYAAALDPSLPAIFSRAILWSDPDAPSGAQPKVIGGLICRLEPSPFDPVTGHLLPAPTLAAQQRAAAAAAATPAASQQQQQQQAIYIQSLALLSPYRSLGLATAVVESILSSAAAAASPSLSVTAVYAHVWTENADGLRWYEARGFARDQLVRGYYFKLRPDTAWIVRRDVKKFTNTSSSIMPLLNGAPRYVPPPAPGGGSTTAAAVNLGGFESAQTGSDRGVSSATTSSFAPPPKASPTPTPVQTTAAAAPPAPASATPGSTAQQQHQQQRPSPSPSPHSLSFQNKRANTEWNDLPEDMVSVSRNSSRSDLLSPPAATAATTGPPGGKGATGGSGASSRSSSTAPNKKKRDRAYPAAAFGS